MQRLATNDLIGWIKGEGAEGREKEHADKRMLNWDIVEIPALNEDGTSFYPDRFPVKDLIEIRDSDPSTFYAQYQQQPIADSNRAIYDIRRFQQYETLPNINRVVQSWDTAYEIGEKNDYSVCLTWGIVNTQFGDNYYLIDVWRGKLEYYDLKNKFIELQEKYNPYKILVEKAASARSLLQDFTNLGNSRTEPIIPDKKKEIRAIVPSSLINLVYLPIRASWLSLFLDEVRAFPNPKVHDDQVDSMNQFLNWANKPVRKVYGAVV